MENFNFYAPTYFAFGKNRENDCGVLCWKKMKASQNPKIKERII